MRYVILCSLLLLSFVSISCTQRACTWHEVTRFDPSSFGSAYSKQQEPFSVSGEKFRLRWTASKLAAYGEGAGYFAIDLYRYPDMKLVESAVYDTDVGGEGEVHKVVVQAGKGMYCLFIYTGKYVGWAVHVDECT